MRGKGWVVNNSAVSAPTIVIKAGSSPTAKHSAFNYKIDGKFYQKAAADLPALVGTVADDFHCFFVFLIDAAGTVTVAKGDDVAITTALDLRTQVYETAGVMDGLCPVGLIYVKNETAADFVGGTTALDVAGSTVAYVDAFGYEGL